MKQSIYILERQDVETSATRLLETTNRIIPWVKECQKTPLKKVYPITWVDALQGRIWGKIILKAVI